MKGELTFSVRGGDAVASAEWVEVSSLFSSEYGYYSAAAPQRAGGRIRLGEGYYRRSYATGDYRVAFCRDGSKLVAEAIYLERKTSRGTVALVVQLVVVSASGEIVRTAYRHMPQDEQAWASKTADEVDVILNAVSTGKEILLFARKGS